MIRRVPKSLEGVLEKWTNLTYLKENAGDVSVRVEKRSSTSENFGRGSYENMPFRNFLQLLEGGDKGSEAYYMNTQRFEGSEDELLTGPLKKLKFPLVPDVCPNLIPADYNIWMGRTGSTGSSSGLHHDYHDNLYVLMRGRKRFRLFSPKDAHEMNTHGMIKRVWENGRICYSKDVLADGVPIDERKRHDVETRQREIESKMDTIQKDMEKCSDSDVKTAMQEEYARLETELEEILESALSLMMDNSVSKTIESNDSSPPHFSQIDLDNTKSHTPSFREVCAKRMAVVEIEEGNMLYLPAGWFHEVRSRPSIESSWHFAFNYWFHPPTTSSFEEPYDSKYHATVWKDIISSIK